MTDALGSPLLVLICWVMAGAVSLFGALSNAEIAGMYAGSGGEYVYFKKIYGRFMGFLYGWSVFSVIKTAAVSSIAYVFAQSFHALVPLPSLPAGWEAFSLPGSFTPFANAGVKGLTIMLIVVLTFWNSRGLKGGARLSGLFTLLVGAGLAFTVFTSLVWGKGDMTNFSMAPSTGTTGGWFHAALIPAIFSAMVSAFWAYEGWNTIGFLGGEIKQPNRNIPIALIAGIGIVMLTFVIVNFSYLYVLPAGELAALSRSANQIAAVEVLRSFGGQAGAIALTLIILVTTFGCTNSTIIMPPRIYQAMAEDGYLPGKIASIHPRYHTPHPALWLQGIWACMLVLSGSFDQLTDMLIFVVFIFYGATALGVFILRHREPNHERPYRSWGYPVVPALFIAFCIALVIITCFNKPREALMGAVLVLAGIPVYLFRQKDPPQKTSDSFTEKSTDLPS